MDKKLKRLKKELSKLGLDEEKQKEILDIVNSDDAEDDDAEEIVEEEVEKVEPEEDASPEGEGEAPSEEPEPVDPLAPESEEEPVEEPPVEDTPLPEGMEEVDPNQIGNEVPPVNPDEPVPNPTPETPTVDYEARLAEQGELIAAQKARIDSLEQQLKAAGILTDASVTNQVGVDENTAPANDPIDDPVERVLREVNRKY